MGEWHFGDDALILLDYGEMLFDSDSTSVEVGDRSFNPFFDPGNFNLQFCGEEIALRTKHRNETDRMTVRRIEGNEVLCEESMDMSDMNDYQKTVTFLYLLGRVVDGCED